jgi:hypothetical protein
VFVKPAAVAIVEKACDALAGGSLTAAITQLERLDLDALTAEYDRRCQAVPSGKKRSKLGKPSSPVTDSAAPKLYRLDSWTCTYSPCGYSLTIDKRVLTQLQRVTGVWLAKRDGHYHPITYVNQAAPDHVLGGGSLITTACWGCNGPKTSIPFETLMRDLGWDWQPYLPPHPWQGLTEHLEMLKQLPTGERFG